jgi:predicted DCC family thiol-disulfide oxidoreductase YuxK
MSEALPPRLVLYDGVCGLCDRSVQWLLAHDPEGRLHFAPLQGETAASLRARHPSIPSEVESIVFVTREGEGERVYLRSRAAFRIARELPGPARFLGLLRFLPRFLTDLGYRLVARVRYRVWGELEQCRVPRPGERARFHP